MQPEDEQKEQNNERKHAMTEQNVFTGLFLFF
jgi:hypothetical protein